MVGRRSLSVYGSCPQWLGRTSVASQEENGQEKCVNAVPVEAVGHSLPWQACAPLKSTRFGGGDQDGKQAPLSAIPVAALGASPLSARNTHRQNGSGKANEVAGRKVR